MKSKDDYNELRQEIQERNKKAHNGRLSARDERCLEQMGGWR